MTRRFTIPRAVTATLLVLSLGVSIRAANEPAKAAPPATVVQFGGKPIRPMHGSASGFWFMAENAAPQLALMGHPPNRALATLDANQQITIRIPASAIAAKTRFSLRAVGISGGPTTVTLSAGSGKSVSQSVARPPSAVQERAGQPRAAVPQTLALDLKPTTGLAELTIDITAANGPAVVSLDDWALAVDGRSAVLPVVLQNRDYPERGPVASSPLMHSAIEQAIIEWDWGMQDGIGTPQGSQTFPQAVEKTLARGDLLLADLHDNGGALAEKAASWAKLRVRYEALKSDAKASDADWESLWLDVHRLRRAIVLANPAWNVGPLLFVKNVPSTMSHQLTQYYGYTARPGGGLFVLDEPGHSMRVRQLAQALPPGSYSRPEVSHDGATVLFGFCRCETGPENWGDPKCMDRHYHLHSANAGGSDVKQLTDGPYDDFAPIELPSGKLVFCSTRRGGFHRCGKGPCFVYTLAQAEADGSNPHPISFHETNEWDPAVLNDGRIVYTRWDYVDRNAVFYQQLWSVRQDGSDVRIFYGNNTFNPAGTWEARPVPGSNKVMATAAAHHGMTAGSIILIDPSRGVDGTDPITRLTPDALFPEAESGLFYGKEPPAATRHDDQPTNTWGPQAWSQPTRLGHMPEEETRWPGHCYRSPYPLSEKYFLAAYSFDRLRGEPGLNRPNMFGLYAVDAFGNKELLYRDPNLSSQWPMPLRPRTRPPVLEMPSRWAQSTKDHPEGTFFLRNVHESWPKLPDVEIKRLRIVQVLPKTTPNANQPAVGLAMASPGKQVLGTVPVEKDGSAYFRAPAKTPVLFQALDARGRAVQTMRSLTYLQPGEQVSCVGCHESRMTTSRTPGTAMALAREPSTIAPGPDGSKPLSYPLLVQPVLERQCVRCHTPNKPEGKIDLSAAPAGAFSQSYHALAPFVSYTAWGMPNDNYEPLTTPDRFGARASRLIEILDKGHYDVKLSADEWDRIITWIDANALFYGTFKPADQEKQRRGERIAGPELE
jgi:hypothetical protein